MSMPRHRPSIGILLVALALGGSVLTLRRFSLHRAATMLSTKIPRGAMAIRRESLVDLTVDGRPIRQTVFIAEAAEGSEILSGEAEDLSQQTGDDSEEDHEPDPGNLNSSGTLTDVEENPDDGDSAAVSAELQAEAEAVLADAVVEEAALEAEADALVAEAELIHESADDEHDTADADPADADAADADESPEEAKESAEPSHVTSMDGHCPESHPIKVRFATGRFHEPDSPSYSQVVADACYKSVEAATVDGFSPSPL